MAQARKKSVSKRRYWSARVTRESDALDLERGVFKKGRAKAIAASRLATVRVFTGPNGLPIGAQLVGGYGADYKTLACAEWAHWALS